MNKNITILIKKIKILIIICFIFSFAKSAQAQRYFINPERLTPTALMRAYENNFVEADTKYTGKLVILTGRIRIIPPQNHTYKRNDSPFAVLEANPYQPIAVYFWEWDDKKINSLPSGNVVTVMGFCQGIFPQMSLMNACLYPKECGGPLKDFYGPHFKSPPTKKR